MVVVTWQHSMEWQTNYACLDRCAPYSSQGKFCVRHGNILKPDLAQDFTDAWICVDKFDCVENTYVISKHMWKHMKHLFFCLLDVSIMNNFVLLISCSSKLSTLHFRYTLAGDKRGNGATTTDNRKETNLFCQSNDQTLHGMQY
jgi:hypothetical protein